MKARGWSMACFGAMAVGTVVGACGGTAIVDGPEGGGGTGATSTGTTPSGTGGTGTGTTTTPTGTGGGVPTACQQFCSVLAQCTSSTPTCVQDCQSASSAECTDSFLAFLQCAILYTSPPACDPTDACFTQVQVWTDCESGQPPPPPPCGPMSCYVGSDGSCGCEVSCPEATYSTECAGSGPNNCRCAVNGYSAGSCTDSGANLCDPYAGCCAPYLFGFE